VFVDLPEDLSHAIEGARSSLGPFANVLYAEEVDSTNDLALALAESGRPEGTSVLADLQRKGRGRRGRSWYSPPAAGLYISVIVRPVVPDASAALVTLAAGAALAEAVTRTTALPVELKWPNDLVIGRPWRKLGGVLTEASIHGGRLEGIVIGVGLNLQPASYPAELAHRATSLETELGRPVSRALVLVALLEELRRVMRLFDGRTDGAVAASWRRFGHRAIDGARVRWQDPRGERRGRTRDVDADGALVVEVDGRRERIVAGEVIWEELSRG
jgi:BirA family transcriptional regulator, biotin operon repressor / biotin---[acetyl-CoA-carboxylase] ligase